MKLFFCDNCKKENIYYLIVKNDICYFIRNCCYENSKKFSTKKFSLKKYLIPIDTIIKLLSNKDMEEDTIYKLRKFQFENYYSKKGLLNLKDFNKYKDIYNINILNAENFLTKLEIEKTQLMNNKNYEKIKYLQEKYNMFKMNIQNFIMFYKLIVQKIKKNDNFNILDLCLNVFKFKDLNQLFEKYKNKEIDDFIMQLDPIENFIVKTQRIKDYYLIEIPKIYPFHYKNYSCIYYINKKKSDELYKVEIGIDKNIHYNFDDYVDFSFRYLSFLDKEHFLIYRKDQLFLYKLIFNDDKSFSTKLKALLELKEKIKSILILQDKNILVLSDSIITLLSINIETNKFTIRSSFRYNKFLKSYDFAKILEISGNLLLTNFSSELLLLNKEIFQLERKSKDDLYNKNNKNIFYHNLGFENTYYFKIFEIKEGILLFDIKSKLRIFSLETKQFISMINYDFQYSDNNFLLFKDSILIDELYSTWDKDKYMKKSYFIDFKKFEKKYCDSCLGNGQFWKLKNKNDEFFQFYSVYLTQYKKVGFNIQIIAFYEFVFFDHNLKIELIFSLDKKLEQNFKTYIKNFKNFFSEKIKFEKENDELFFFKLKTGMETHIFYENEYEEVLFSDYIKKTGFKNNHLNFTKVFFEDNFGYLIYNPIKIDPGRYGRYSITKIIFEENK
jgi:hypothetical protein